MRQRGGENSCRCKVLVATTLLDPEKHPPAEIAAVYLRRWRIKLSFRDIKTSMELEHLRAESPEIAAKELLAGLVAYNLVRVTMIEAACRHGAPLDRLSFKGTVDGLCGTTARGWRVPGPRRRCDACGAGCSTLWPRIWCPSARGDGSPGRSSDGPSRSPTSPNAPYLGSHNRVTF